LVVEVDGVEGVVDVVVVVVPIDVDERVTTGLVISGEAEVVVEEVINCIRAKFSSGSSAGFPCVRNRTSG